MPRQARKKSSSGIYHIILRGQNKQIIFEDDEDKEKFLQTLDECKSKSGFSLHGYSLMGNHIHLLIRECDEDLGIIMRRLGASYVFWYNRKYKRCGHLFQDRYKSETVEDDRYFLTVLRYIHRNALKSGLVKKIEDYKWSSYNDYLNINGITDTDFVFNIIDTNKDRAAHSFIAFHKQGGNDQCMEIQDRFWLSDEEAHEIILRKCGVKSSLNIKEFEQAKRDRYIAEFKKAGLSTRQIERLTGISRPIILKA